MFGRSARKLSLVDKVVRECEARFVQFVQAETERTDWIVHSSRGEEYKAVLTLDEWTDSPVVEIRKVDTEELVISVALSLSGWPKK